MAARYGNQPLSEILDMTWDRLKAFNKGIEFWVTAENKTGHNHER